MHGTSKVNFVSLSIVFLENDKVIFLENPLYAYFWGKKDPK